jgi:hypothetical protein
MGTTLEGKKPGGADATFRWLLHTGNATLASPRRISTGDGLDTGLVLGASSIGVANADGHVLTFDASALTAGRSIIWRDLAGTVALLSDLPDGLPAGGDPGQVLTIDEELGPVWSDPLAGSEGGDPGNDPGKAVLFRSGGAIGATGSLSLFDATGGYIWGLSVDGVLTSPRVVVVPNASGTMALDSTALMLAGDQTAAGAKTFSGQIELTGQTAASAESALTRGLGDSRYLSRRGGLATAVVIDTLTGWAANAAVGGSGATASGRTIIVSASTTLNSEAYLRSPNYQPQVFAYPGMDAAGADAGINWNKRTYFGFRITVSHGSNSSPGAGTEGYIRFGMLRTNVVYGALPAKGIGIKIEAGSLRGMVHDGTTLNLGAAFYTTGSALSPVNLVEIIGDGAGSFDFYINGAYGYTLTGGPTGFSGQEGTATNVMVKNILGGASTNCSITIANGQFIFSYLE